MTVEGMISGSVGTSGNYPPYSYKDRIGATMNFTVNVSPRLRDIAVADVLPSKTIICQGYNLNITVTAMDTGDSPETFNVTVYANTTSVETQTVNNLLNGTSTVLNFSWNTTGFAVGNYLISAYAPPVPGETNMMDNNLAGGWIMVAILGDINGDGRVDMKDVSYAARRFMCLRGDPLWDSNADMNGDGKIDMKDISAIARHFGQHYS